MLAFPLPSPLPSFFFQNPNQITNPLAPKAASHPHLSPPLPLSLCFPSLDCCTSAYNRFCFIHKLATFISKLRHFLPPKILSHCRHYLSLLLGCPSSISSLLSSPLRPLLPLILPLPLPLHPLRLPYPASPLPPPPSPFSSASTPVAPFPSLSRSTNSSPPNTALSFPSLSTSPLNSIFSTFTLVSATPIQTSLALSTPSTAEAETEAGKGA